MTPVRRVSRESARLLGAALAVVAALLVTTVPSEAIASSDTYRLPWHGSETWQVSQGPGASHASWPGYSAWDIFPISVGASEAHVLAVGDGTASLLCDDGLQATIELTTEQGHVFHYAHLHAGSVQDAGITSSGIAVVRGSSLGRILNDTDGWSGDCGAGSGPHLHFEIQTSALPMLIDGHTFEHNDDHVGAQLTSTNGVGGGTTTPGADFNGDGYDDVAIGVPGQSVGGFADAGKVHVIYGSASGVSPTKVIADQAWTQDSPNIADTAESGDLFGAVVASGDFNGDGYSDLAAGAPGEDLGGKNSVGSVHIIYGSPSGLSAGATRSDQRYTQNSANIAGRNNPDDRFGASVSAGDFNGDGHDDLAIGTPGEDLGGKDSVGSVHIIYGSPTGLSATATRSDQRFTQDSANIANSNHPDDRFGTSVSAGDFNGDGHDDLAIGTPGEDVGGNNGAGSIHVIYGSQTGLSATATRNDQRFTQNSAYIADAAEAGDEFGAVVTTGDFNGDGRRDMAVGAPGEDLSGKADAGIVHVIYGSSTGLSATAAVADQTFSQGAAGITNAVHTGDLFGAALTARDTNGDGYSDLAVGAPGEDVAGNNGAGSLHVIYGSGSGLSASATRDDQRFTQNSAYIASAAAAGDEFGRTVGAGDFNGDGHGDLAIGAPGETVAGKNAAGGVHIIYGASGGLSPTATRSDQLFTEATAGVAGTTSAGDGFGRALTGRRSG